MKNKKISPRATIVKLIFIFIVLGLELTFTLEYIGLIFLTVVFSIFLLWNTLYFIRYFLIFAIASIILIPSAFVLHKHFYNWRNIARIPVLIKLADLAEEVVQDSSDEKSRKFLATITNNHGRKFDQFVVTAMDKDNNSVFKNKSTLHGPNKISQKVVSKNNMVTIEYDQLTWSYWEWDWQWPMDWDGTYFRYWRALLRGEVVLANPPKYLDLMMVHIVLLLLVVVVYLYVNFERNYRQSKYLLKRLKTVIESKEQ